MAFEPIYPDKSKEGLFVKEALHGSGIKKVILLSVELALVLTYEEENRITVV